MLTRRRVLTLASAGLAAGLTSTLAGCSSGGPTSGAPASAGTATGASASTGASAASGARAIIGLTYIPNIQFAPFYTGVGRGLYQAAGVDVTLRHHGASEGLFTALAAGQEDFVIAGADEMLQARAQGMDVVAIAPYYRQYPAVLVVPADSPIKTAADLKGRSVGVPGRYGESWFGLKVLLNSAGLAEADVTIQEIGYTQQAALTSKKVDSTIGFINNDVVQFNAGGFPVRTIPLTSGALPLVSISLMTTQKYLDAHGDAARRVASATMKALEAVVANPAGALVDAEAFVPALKTDANAKAAAARTLEATLPLWTDASGKVSSGLDAAQFAAMATFMQQQGLLAQPVDGAKAMSNAYQG